MIFLILQEPEILQKNLSQKIKPFISEYLWDRNYNKEIWNKENMQVLNLAFSNID